MAKEDFINLFQIQSINKNSSEIRLKMSDEQNRINLLEKKKGNTQETLLQLKEELKLVKRELLDFEKKLVITENKIEKNNTNILNITSDKQLKSLESETRALSLMKETVETKVFELLEQDENITNEINDLTTFSKGLSHSIQVISEEVELHNSSYQNDLKNNTSKINNLNLQVDNIFLTAYQNIFMQNNDDLALSYIDGNKCGLCKFQIGTQVAQSIETGRIVELCPECSRLLAPISAKNI